MTELTELVNLFAELKNQTSDFSESVQSVGKEGGILLISLVIINFAVLLFKIVKNSYKSSNFDCNSSCMSSPA